MSVKLVLLLALCLVLSLHCVRADESDSESTTTTSISDDDSSSASSESDAPQQEEEVNAVKKIENGQKFDFQAQVSSIMDIIIHSLYSKKEVFLREVISNAADACDKVRFLGLTNKEVLGEGENAKLEIKIKADSKAKTLTITDSGVGMTREDLIQNLGTVARSGAQAFLENYGNSADVSLIGQFGVGFYSVFLVADTVTVVSKHHDDKQQIWQSSADGSFVVAEDTEGPFMFRGTSVTLHLKEDATEYLDTNRLKSLVTKTSEFINFPIYLWTSSTETVEVEEEEEAKPAEESADEDVKIGEDDEEKPKKEKKKETRTTWDWEHLNDNKAIWLRPTKEVTEEEYNSFFRSFSKADEDPLVYSHFVGEGDVNMRAVLFIPKKAPWDFYEKYSSHKQSNIKFYVKRVLITDEFEELLPRYLSFVTGVVDSEDMPLHVSREILQQSKILEKIKSKLSTKVLGLLKKLSEDKDQTDYETFWGEFGKAVKLGVIEDQIHREKLAHLLRYKTTKSEGKFISLQNYIDNMKPKQQYIYYASGDNEENILASPQLERLLKRGNEVLLMTDAIDEYAIQNLPSYNKKKLINVSKADLKFGDETDEEKEEERQIKEDFKDFTKWLKELLDTYVDKVVISNRITKSPAVLVSGAYAWTANMERIMRAQAFADPSKAQHMIQKKTMEINPRHPVVRALKERSAANPADDATRELARVLYDTALLNSGYSLEASDAANFSMRMVHLLSKGLDIDPNSPVEEVEEVEPSEEPAAAEAEATEEAEPEGHVDL